MRWPVFVVAIGLASAAHGADIGGWMQQKERAAVSTDECAALIAQAGRTAREADGAAHLYYASGLCYLYSDKVARDPVAASAWLSRAAELDHPLARRALLAVRDSAAAPHPPGAHCHDLCLGRKLCHGSASAQ
jgi:TPR repeat protein